MLYWKISECDPWDEMYSFLLSFSYSMYIW